MTKHQQVADLLLELTDGLKAADLWQDSRPPEQALQSQQPFALDTLDFHQWLQFIFIEKMQIIVQQQLSMPSLLCLTPIAEEAFSGQTSDKITAILQVIKRIDQLFE
ncbi:YqcC family protein [Catenovulum agarivorans]|uniref:YqcC family protein n=1 Tax=Catenovulum agarivorans TaxID=1172192 RepID=UPI0003158281|nr:YqcC family protein [Catenovulum agarivorans]